MLIPKKLERAGMGAEGKKKDVGFTLLTVSGKPALAGGRSTLT